MLDVGSLIGGGVAGIATSLLIESCKRYIFVPRFKLSNKDDRRVKVHAFVRPNDDNVELESWYVRVPIENLSLTTAKNCRVYLTGVQRFSSDGVAQQTDFAESLRLRWAYESGLSRDSGLHSGIDIPKGVPFIVDLFSTKLENGCAVRLLEVADRGARDGPTITRAIQPDTEYRLQFMITSESSAPTKGWMDIAIGSNWDSVEVKRLEMGEPYNCFWEG